MTTTQTDVRTLDQDEIDLVSGGVTKIDLGFGLILWQRTNCMGISYTAPDGNVVLSAGGCRDPK